MADPDPTPDPAPDPEPDPTPDPTPDPADDPIKPEDDWQAKARKHERDAKRLRAENEKLAKAQKERDDAAKSEQDRAIDAAREEGKTAAETETSQKYRDKLLKAEVRAQAAGKFANPALAIKLLDLDHDAIFDDDGEIDGDAIATAIDTFLEQEPSLKVGGGGPGQNDAGKGSGAGKSAADMTIEDHLKDIARTK